MTPRELCEQQIKAELEMFYRVSVDEAVLSLNHLLQQEEKEDDAA